MNGNTPNCWLCGESQLELVKESNICDKLNRDNFKITDACYGVTESIYRCMACGFMQCSDMDNIIDHYEQMEDISYEQSRSARAIQSHRLLLVVKRWQPNGRLLDVGAGSGILIEEAVKLGYQAEGIEPSKYLQNQAMKHNLKVYLGTLPHTDIKHSYEVVTLIDVIEHVQNPLFLLNSIRQVMNEKGIGMLVTPDVNSIAARLMGWKWWHYRVAHIGYFNHNTLSKALNLAGLKPIVFYRPSWYFSGDYLIERLMLYLPKAIRFSVPRALSRLTVPLNLFDSILVLFKKV